MFENISREISSKIKEGLGVDASKFIFFPKNEKGDLSIRMFAIAKMLNKEVEDIGKVVSKRLRGMRGIKNISFEKGYINIFFDEEYIIEEFKSKMNKKNKKKNKKVVVEFPSVNPNKPWHIGHLRNALLGESLSRIMEYYGFDVERINYINDLGLQVAESFYYYLKYKEECKEKFDHCIGKQYVKAHKLCEENKEVEEEVRKLLKEIEKGNKEARMFIEKVLKAQYKTAKEYGVCSDKAVFESNLTSLFEDGMKKLKENNQVYYSKEEKNKGCLVIKTNERGNLSNEKILVRSDGTLTYTGKDIIFHLWKLGKLSKVKFKVWNEVPSCNEKKGLLVSDDEGVELNENADMLVNIIGIEQSYPQNIVKNAIERLGYENEKIIHLAYSFVRLKDKKFSGRKGTWIGFTADELLKEGVRRVLEKHKKVGESNAKKIAKAAIKLAILRVNAKKEVVFDWDRVLSTEGDSGVYLLYSYVRANSIIKKSKKQGELKKISREEVPLIMDMIMFDDVVEESVKNMDPAILSNYLLKLSKTFHKFYSTKRIIGSDEEESLIYIVKEYIRVMEKGMNLLGMETLEEM